MRSNTSCRLGTAHQSTFYCGGQCPPYDKRAKPPGRPCCRLVASPTSRPVGGATGLQYDVASISPERGMTPPTLPICGRERRDEHVEPSRGGGEWPGLTRRWTRFNRAGQLDRMTVGSRRSRRGTRLLMEVFVPDGNSSPLPRQCDNFVGRGDRLAEGHACECAGNNRYGGEDLNRCTPMRCPISNRHRTDPSPHEPPGVLLDPSLAGRHAEGVADSAAAVKYRNADVRQERAIRVRHTIGQVGTFG